MDAQIKGVIFNRISESIYKNMAEMAQNLGIIPIGYVPKLTRYNCQAVI